LSISSILLGLLPLDLWSILSGMIPTKTFSQPQQNSSFKLEKLWSDPIARAFSLTALTLLGLLGGVLASLNGATTIMWACYGLAFLAGGIPAAREAFHTLFSERKLDVDLLMVVAALGAASVNHAEDGAILLFLFSLSNALQDWALGRTKNAIQALMHLSPEGATVIRDGREQWMRLEEILKDDVLLVKPGERFAADSTILEGASAIDESAITGESVPVEKEPGSTVFSGTLNGSGVLRVRVEKPAGESTLAKLSRLVERAQAAKSPTEQFADRLEGPYTIAVLFSIPVVFVFAHFVFGLELAASWYRAMTFLVVASPCAVVISTPAAMLSAMAAGARVGVLFKSGAALEELSRVKTVAMDKTGTLTEGKMKLVEVKTLEGSHDDLLALAAGLEQHSEHPVAAAVVSAYRGIPVNVTEVQGIRGKGITGSFEGHIVWAGTRTLALEQGALLSDDIEAQLNELENNGLTTMILGRETKVLALLAVADTPRQDAKLAVKALHRSGLRVAMLTGDRQAVAEHIAKDLGVDDVRAELLPEHKLEVISDLKNQRSRPKVRFGIKTGGVAMVGDGVNDAPALASADIGISMGSGSDVALESSDVVLMKNDLSRLAGAVQLARAASNMVRFNLTFALSVIVIMGILSLLGKVPLPLGVIAHEGGTVFVVLNGIRLLAHPVKA
jgi:Cd2+/Zn2+-exporting ATPase